jgi:predicted  nucleic acid-binding Zn-ribbon protein
MATKSKAKSASTVAERLDALSNLQRIDSEIDRLLTVRGELPLEVEDLEDEISGLQTRINKLTDELNEIETEISDRKNAQKDAQAAIIGYKEKQNNVRNNREFESLSKEIEYQELEIQLHEKKSKEAKYRAEQKKEVLDEAIAKVDKRKEDLVAKKSELDAIVAETEKDEEKLKKQSEKAKKKIDDHLQTAYDRLRENAKNGLAVVPVDRNSCGGCFNRIPPQRQLDIVQKKKIIVCEHCGRILVPSENFED